MSVQFIKIKCLCFSFIFFHFSNYLYSQSAPKNQTFFEETAHKSDVVCKIIEGRRGVDLFENFPIGWQWHEWKMLANNLGGHIWFLIKNDEEVAQNLSGIEEFTKQFLLEYERLLLKNFSVVELLKIERFYNQSPRMAHQQSYGSERGCVIQKEKNMTVSLMHSVTYKIRKQRPLDCMIQDIIDGKNFHWISQKKSQPSSCVIL
ncbi:MAG: hypothetical protein AB8C84_08865 [Oligoflexales bacterium]